VVFRVVFIKLIKLWRYRGFNSSRVIIIGDNENGRKIADILSSDLTHGFKVLGFFDNTSENVIGSFDDIDLFVENNEVNEMYIALDFVEAERIERLILLGERYMVRVKFVPNFYSYTKARKVRIDFYGNMPILMLREEPLQLPFNRLIKRFFDVVLSVFVILFIFSWLFPILMFLVYVSSKGPVFYRQVRSGEDNNPFICLKFRSMKLSTDDFVQATKNDPRVTGIGRILRKTNLDELPQVFNVLIGQMSIVGPRPHPLKLDEQYHQMVEKYLVRHFAKPGITGWAQVNGCRGETRELKDMQRRVDYDIWYIENWSFLLDLKIIWRTVVNMVRGDKNAY
jgi:undecaprenyl-phosphate galactose phosphotransferase/putative colanic acid biosynthesis UDP-glucose lipid carrier transferase